MQVDNLKIGFLASHGGTSMRKIHRAIRSGELPASVTVVISNNKDSNALDVRQGRAAAS
jgi:phosphoribosylglycinamide formyltransferase-1